MNTKHLKTKSAEAVQEGIITTLVDKFGEVQESNVIGFDDAITLLDKGEYDNEAPAALCIAAALLEAQAAGFYQPNNERVTVYYRWLVADIFIRTMIEENGTRTVEQDDGTTAEVAVYVGKHGAMSVYAIAERFSLANHVEAVSFEVLGMNDGYLMATNIYRSFITDDFSLSEQGREMFELLHDGFMEQLNEDGLPDAQMVH